jgi:hypothetical protein
MFSSFHFDASISLVGKINFLLLVWLQKGAKSTNIKF